MGIKCSVGLHKWKEWAYVGQNNCQRVQVCEECGKQKTLKKQHVWTDWQYHTENACEQVSRCRRCNEQETKLHHLWSDWQYESDNSCVSVQTCQRCKEKKYDDVVTHQWRTPIYEAANNASVVM